MIDKPQAIIIDIDGVLADHRHRLPLLPDYNEENIHDYSIQEEFENFNHMSSEDPYNHFLQHMMSKMIMDYHVLLITARPERHARITEDWLKDGDIEYDRIFYRPNDEFCHDYELKKWIYERRIEQHYDVVAVFEDKDAVVRMWEDLRLPVYQFRGFM